MYGENNCNKTVLIYVEHNNHIDAEQEGFRKFHSTSMALLRLVQNIYDGFNENESTVGVFIDMEKAFDSVWRKGLLHKLYNMGVKGRMWDWLNSYFTSERSLLLCAGCNREKFPNRNWIASRFSIVTSAILIVYC